jgi:hypothetical protein
MAAQTDLPASQALVSVLIRSTDRSSLDQALASVAQQTYAPMEVVVAAARPGHRPLPAQAGAATVKLVPTERALERSAAANIALRAATGRYCIFLDDDDWFMPTHVQRLVQTLAQTPQAKAAYTAIALTDEAGQPMGQLDHPFDETRLLSGNLMPIHAVLFERSLVTEQACQFDESLSLFEDWDFWLQVSQKTSFLHLPEPTAVYRIHASSGVHENSPATQQARHTLMRKWQDTLPPEKIAQWMRRVWLANDLQRELVAAQTQVGKLDQELVVFKQLALRNPDPVQASQVQMLQTGLAQMQEQLGDFRGSSSDVLQQLLQQQAGVQTQLSQHAMALAESSRMRTSEAQYQAQLAGLGQQVRDLEHSIFEYTHSTSWRVTAPLRWLGRIPRRFMNLWGKARRYYAVHGFKAFIKRSWGYVFEARTTMHHAVLPAVATHANLNEPAPRGAYDWPWFFSTPAHGPNRISLVLDQDAKAPGVSDTALACMMLTAQLAQLKQRRLRVISRHPSWRVDWIQEVLVGQKDVFAADLEIAMDWAEAPCQSLDVFPAEVFITISAVATQTLRQCMAYSRVLQIVFRRAELTATSQDEYLNQVLLPNAHDAMTVQELLKELPQNFWQNAQTLAPAKKI